MKIKQTLKALGLKNNEIKVYLALTKLGESNSKDIAKKANLPRTTAISILERLKERGYISIHQYKGKNIYWIESPQLIVDKYKNLAKMAGMIEEKLTDLYRSDAHFPGAEVFDTKKGIKEFIENFLLKLPKNLTIYTIDSPRIGNYRKILSENYEKILLETKRKRSITTKTLIPYHTFRSIKKEKLQEQKIIIKEMPQEIDFKASLWFTDNLLILFSGRIPFVVAIRHRLIINSLKTIYDYLWLVSKSKYGEYS